MLRDASWQVNDKRVERLWRREGLKVPTKQPKKARLWLNDGSCVRLRPEYRNHVWSYDFVHHRTDDGKAFRTLNILDEHSRDCLAIRVKRKLNSTEVIDALTDLFILRGVPCYIRSDNGPEFIAEAVRNWIAAVGAKTAYIEPGSPLSGHRHAMPCRAVRGRMDTVKASMPGSAMNCSTAKSFTGYAKPGSLSKNGENTTIPNDPTVHWATAHRLQKPSSRWHPSQSCTNIQNGPLRWG